MKLNEFGKIAFDAWTKTPQLRPNVALGEFVIMPNHIHGIIYLLHSPLRGPSQTIGAIVRGYKSSVTKQLGIMGFDEKLWQRNYYEHIIRNEQSYNNISNYIINNPAKWQEDKFYIR